MEETKNIISDILNLENDILEKTKQQNVLRNSVGAKEINKIYSICMQSTYQKKIDKEIDTLLSFVVEEKRYNIVFGSLEDYLPNQYFLVSDLEKIVLKDDMEKIISYLDHLETILHENVLLAFESLSVSRKNAHFELKRINASRKRRYTYAFSGEFRKHIFGFVAMVCFKNNA